jgi:transposase-like protein
VDHLIFRVTSRHGRLPRSAGKRQAKCLRSTMFAEANIIQLLPFVVMQVFLNCELMKASDAKRQGGIFAASGNENLNMSLHKIIKNRAAFPSEEAAYQLLYLALQNIQKKWTMPIHDWARALNQLAILFDGRLTNQNSLTQNF